MASDVASPMGHGGGADRDGGIIIIAGMKGAVETRFCGGEGLNMDSE
jgi:hypothetical protein